MLGINIHFSFKALLLVTLLVLSHEIKHQMQVNDQILGGKQIHLELCFEIPDLKTITR